MSERAVDVQHDGGGERHCPTCGTPYHAGDRFCAQCGTTLPATETTIAPPESAPTTADGDAKRGDALWLFAAPPRTVIGGGILVLLLAVALLVIGQFDRTGTIVMASICLAPLALLTLAIGVVRGVVR